MEPLDRMLEIDSRISQCLIDFGLVTVVLDTADHPGPVWDSLRALWFFKAYRVIGVLEKITVNQKH